MHPWAQDSLNNPNQSRKKTVPTTKMAKDKAKTKIPQDKTKTAKAKTKMPKAKIKTSKDKPPIFF